MKTTTLPAALFAFITAVAAYPARPGLRARGCEPGTLVCNGSDKFALCNIDSSLYWMQVSDGTVCVCSGSSCTIASITGDSGSSIAIATSNPASTKTTVVMTLSTQTETDAQTQTQIPPTNSKPFQNNPEIGHVPTQTSEPPAVDNKPPTSVPSVEVSSVPPPPVTAPTSESSATAPKTTSSPDPDPGYGSGSGSASGSGNVAGKTYLRTFTGTGDPSQGWPRESQWVDFESMWSANLANTIYKSCAAFNQENNSDKESADLKQAIQSVSKSSGVDARFILAVVMQESGGCVRAPTTNYGVTNPGLMQSHDGAHSCYNINPCPSSQILGMVKDGVTGTSSGQGLKQILATAGSNVSQYYKASRIYNSGSIAATGLLQDGIATRCYASDIANRLIGWSSGVGACKLN